MNTGNYGHSICAVVYEGAGHPGCQFTFTCNGDLDPRQGGQPPGANPKCWRREILTGEVPLHNATGGRDQFPRRVGDARTGPIRWNKTTQIGNHIFYRGSVRRIATADSSHARELIQKSSPISRFGALWVMAPELM